jgi:heme-degrading monooxygenase HmoA
MRSPSTRSARSSPTDSGGRVGLVSPRAGDPPADKGGRIVHHFRIATYEATDGTPAELAEIAKGGMLPIFKKQPGFQAYSLIQIDEKTVVSLSVWETHQEAEDAVATAADWVKENLASRIKLKDNSIGDALFWEGAAT